MAVREAAHFDRDQVSFTGGLLATIPVVATLGGGLAANDPVAAATMGAGAMLVGIAWRTGGGRPPLALMATDAVVMAAATFVGSATGSVSWLHFVVLCATALIAGMLVVVGNRGAVVGIQAIIAVVVFGRFSQPPAAALGLAGLVLAEPARSCCSWPWCGGPRRCGPSVPRPLRRIAPCRRSQPGTRARRCRPPPPWTRPRRRSPHRICSAIRRS